MIHARSWLLVFLCSAVLAAPGELTAQSVSMEALAALRARSIGPAGMSGRITSIDAVESDPNVLFVGTATGGVWRSENGGQTWDPVFDDERVLGIGAVAVSQSNPEIVWVGTGEGNPRNSAGVGAGIYKSTDGGESWTLMGLEASERIHRIILHPTDPDRVYVGVMGPAWSDGQQRGVYRTIDGGISWERVLFVSPGAGVSDLVMDPSDPDRLLAGMWEFRRSPWFFQSGGPGSGLFLSQDGGTTWERQTSANGLPEGDLGRIGLSFARSRPEWVFALVEAERSALLRSTDGGSTWTVVNDATDIAPRPFYYTDIFVDPQNPERLFNLHSRLTRSEDAGESFDTIGQGVHSDNHALWIDPSDSRTLWLGTDGGVYVSHDRGDHWRFVDNLPVGQFYHVSVDMQVPFNIYGGMQDNGSWRGPSDLWERGGIRNHHWEEVGFGDGFGTLLDPLDSNLGYSMSQGGDLVRFDLRTGERKGIRPWAPEGTPLRFNWNAALALDPLDSEVLYFGSQFVHRTSDRGDSWQIISGDLTSNDPEKQRQEESGGLTRDVTGAENHTTIVTIAPSPAEDEVIWVGTDDGRVQITRSGGGDWQEVGRRIRGVPEGTWVPHIEASKHAGGTAYVVFDDHRRGNWEPYVFRTEDYGASWRNLAENKGIWGFVHVLEEDPVTPNLLFAGTEFGLYLSLDRGETWQRWTHGVPAVPVRSLVIHPRDHDLVIGTHGRGVYVLDDIRPLRALASQPDVRLEPVHLFDPPPAFLHNVAAANGYHFPGDAMFQGETRASGAMFTFLLPDGEGDRTPTLEILDLDGRRLRTLEVQGRVGLNRVAWDLREELRSANPGEPNSPEGPEVLPGRYEVRVHADGYTSTGWVEVLPDPRVEIPLAERVEKRNAVVESLGLSAVLDTFQERKQMVTDGVEDVIRVLGTRNDPVADELRQAAVAIRTEVEAIDESAEVARESRSTLGSLTATRDRPTETERIALFRFRESLDPLIRRFNAFLTGEVARFREVVARTEPDLFPPVPVIRR